MMRLEKHDNHCKGIAEELDAIVIGERFRDSEGNEWNLEYEPAYGFDMYVTHVWTEDGHGKLEKIRVAITTKDGETYTRGDTGETIEYIDEYLDQVTLYDYFEDGIYNLEFRTGGRDEDPSSVSIMIAFGGPNIYIDTKTGDVELYWWSESGRYPMRRETIDAINEFATESLWF